MSKDKHDLDKIEMEIEILNKEFDDYIQNEDQTTSNKDTKILYRYRNIMDQLATQNIIFLKQEYICLMNKFLDVLGKKQGLLLAYSNHINKFIKRIANSNDNINYFLGFKTFELIPIYWKIDDNKFEGNSDLNKQLDILKKCFSDESKNRLFDMFQEYYKAQEFKNFSDYSECIKDTVIITYLCDKKYTEVEFEKLAMSIGYAGVTGSIGYDFIGIRTIKNVFGLVDDLEFIKEILSRLASKLTYRREITAEQISAVISSSNIDYELKKKYKFIYITIQLIDFAFKRAVFKSIPRDLDIDNDDDLEFMSNVSLPKLLSLNNNEYSFILEGYDEAIDEKNVYLIRKNMTTKNGREKLFSIIDINESKFEIRWEQEVKIFSFDDLHDLGNFLEVKLKKVFANAVVGDEGEIKLIYFWIEKHKIVEDMALKFSDKYKVVFENEQWKITENPDELDSVLYKDSNDKVKMINAIVGKNGSGKTTLLDAFKYYFNNQSDENVFGKFFIIYEDGENLILKHNFIQDKDYFMAECSKRFRVMRLDKNKNSGILSNTRLLSYTSYTELSNYTGSEHDREAEGNHKDLSIYNDFRILERIKDAREREGVKRQLVSEDSYKKLTLLSESEALNAEFTENIPLPHEILLTIKINKSNDSIKRLINEIDSYLDSWFSERIVEKRFYEKIDGEKVLEEIEYFDLRYRLEISGSSDFSFLYNFVQKGTDSFNCVCTLDFLGLSSGQYAKLTLFSRMFFESDHAKVKGIRKALTSASSYVKYYNIEDISSIYLNYNQNENLMILLDEGDMFFHPEWQKSFISNIKSLLNHAFKDHEIVKTIHLLITSNSPFIMSDIPLEHTIVLGEGYSMEQTYAQNIHDILKSSFFMYNGTLGEVAQRHVKKLISQLQSENVTEADMQYIKKSINMIGEPMIRYKLESMYKKKFFDKIKTEERIKQLEEELVRLKKKED
ncbi:AAA family ATPase [Neobacillus drentensis]|uniref:AAA family ATPase n=1 Tax=Neobacillus drentensis TaxID=220684 RepID=UPI002FFDE8DF